MSVSLFPAGYRASGVLLHVTSLPSPYGIGDVGPAAVAWIDRLHDAGQRWWQALPLGPTGYGVFLVDVDNTLLDNDRSQDELQRYRTECPYEVRRMAMSSCLVERSGITESVDGHVLVDDKPRILAAVKDAWGDRVTTIFLRQGQYARDANAYPAADLAVERIGELVTHDVSQFLSLEVLR